MEPRVSLITLGVADIGRARAFYEALGWEGQSPDGEVVFFQAGGMVVALWGRTLLAEDSMADDTGAAWGGITVAHAVRRRCAAQRRGCAIRNAQMAAVAS